MDLARRIGKFKAGKHGLVAAHESEDNSTRSPDQRATAEEVDASKKKKKKDKEKRRMRNEAWYTFIRRAYVETMTPDELKDEFG